METQFSGRLNIGDAIMVYIDSSHDNKALGFVRYIGLIQKHVGIELIEAVPFGHNGIINGEQYFNTVDGFGLHVPICDVIKKLQAPEILLKLKKTIQIFKGQISEYIHIIKQKDDEIQQLKATQKQLRFPSNYIDSPTPSKSNIIVVSSHDKLKRNNQSSTKKIKTPSWTEANASRLIGLSPMTLIRTDSAPIPSVPSLPPSPTDIMSEKIPNSQSHENDKDKNMETIGLAAPISYHSANISSLSNLSTGTFVYIPCSPIKESPTAELTKTNQNGWLFHPNCNNIAYCQYLSPIQDDDQHYDDSVSDISDVDEISNSADPESVNSFDDGSSSYDIDDIMIDHTVHTAKDNPDNTITAKKLLLHKKPVVEIRNNNECNKGKHVRSSSAPIKIDALSSPSPVITIYEPVFAETRSSMNEVSIIKSKQKRSSKKSKTRKNENKSPQKKRRKKENDKYLSARRSYNGVGFRNGADNGNKTCVV